MSDFYKFSDFCIVIPARICYTYSIMPKEDTPMLAQFHTDRPYIENKYHKTAEPFNPFNRMAYHGWECDPATGYDDEQMHNALRTFRASLPDSEPALIKAKAFAFVLDHMRFAIDEHDYFPCFYNWNRPLNFCTVNPQLSKAAVTGSLAAEGAALHASGDVVFWMDYDHSVPNWHALYELGFPGILARTKEYRARHAELTEKQIAYFDAIAIEYEAILRLLRRMADYAHKQTHAKAETVAASLDRLSVGTPETLLDRLELIYLYFMLSESVDSYQVRSLGSGFDYDITAPYRRDLASGQYTEAELDGFIAYFLLQFSAIGNYWGQPLYLGGSFADGSCKVNEISMKFLDIYDALDIYNPKIQVKYAKNTPRPFLEKILDMIRRGHSSFVFVCEDNVRAKMIEDGIPYDRCYDFDVKGCYEYAVRAGEFSTGPYYINLLGSVVQALKAVDDMADFNTVIRAYEEALRHVFDHGIAYCRALEVSLADVNPAPMLSATITHSLECARDAYADGAEYNTTAFVVGGIGSAVDALMAIRYLVFDEQLVTLAHLKTVLAENWPDEALRQRALSCPHKYGCGDPEADALAKRIGEIVLSYQGIDNHRGGSFKITMHSARQYIELGMKTPATPDGRHAGEETSKNASPTQGMDRNGVTALLRSATALTPDRYREGFGLDVMLHESTVKGDTGLQIMTALLMAYEQNHGSSIQFNVVSAETLRDAQVHPERYQNLQVRICGWNALWNNVPRTEQEKFILRAENIK